MSNRTPTSPAPVVGPTKYGSDREKALATVRQPAASSATDVASIEAVK